MLSCAAGRRRTAADTRWPGCAIRRCKKSARWPEISTVVCTIGAVPASSRWSRQAHQLLGARPTTKRADVGAGRQPLRDSSRNRCPAVQLDQAFENPPLSGGESGPRDLYVVPSRSVSSCLSCPASGKLPFSGTERVHQIIFYFSFSKLKSF